MDLYNLIFNCDANGNRLSDQEGEKRFVTLEDGRVVYIEGPPQGAGRLPGQDSVITQMRFVPTEEGGLEVGKLPVAPPEPEKHPFVQSRFGFDQDGLVRRYYDPARMWETPDPETEQVDDEDDEEEDPDVVAAQLEEWRVDNFPRGHETDLVVNGRPIYASVIDEYAFADLMDTGREPDEIRDALVNHLAETWHMGPRYHIAKEACEYLLDLEDGGSGWVILLSDPDANVYAVASVEEGAMSLHLNFLGTRQSGGLGTLAMRTVADIAIEDGSGLRWQSVDGAIGFYNKIGFEPHLTYVDGRSYYDVSYSDLVDWFEVEPWAAKAYGDEPLNGVFAVSGNASWKTGVPSEDIEPEHGVFAADQALIERAIANGSLQPDIQL